MQPHIIGELQATIAQRGKAIEEKARLVQTNQAKALSGKREAEERLEEKRWRDAQTRRRSPQ